MKKALEPEKYTGLYPYNEFIQICKVCEKIDAYAGDGHSCLDEIIRKEDEVKNEKST
jgi:hypothetical protein